MTRAGDELRLLGHDGLEAWRASHGVGKAVVVGTAVAIWLLPAAPLIGALPDGSRAEAYATSFWWLLGLLLLAGYLGRRRSLRSYENRTDLIALADALDQPVPTHPPWWRELAAAAHRSDRIRVTLRCALALGAVGVATILLDPPARADGGSWGVAAMWCLWGLLPAFAFYVAQLRGERERVFEEAVWGGLAQVTAGDAMGLRRRLGSEVEELQAQIDERKRIIEDLDADEPVGARVLAEVQRLGTDLSKMRNVAILDDRRSMRRDWVMMLLGALVGTALARAAELWFWPD